MLRRAFVCLFLICLLATLIGVPAGGWDGDALVRLARSAVRAEVESKDPPHSDAKTPVRPVFVTIERKGRVIGCRGGLDTRSRTLEEEVILSARAAAGHDPRYRPLTPKDLTDFNVTVTVVDHTEEIDNVDGLTPADGLVLKSGTRTGIVLPWEGKDPKVRLQWAYRKAGVAPGSSCQLYRLRAERFRG